MLFYGMLTTFSTMFILWCIYLITDKPLIVDFGWGMGIALLAILYAIIGDGYVLRKILIAVMAGFWGIRLALYLLFTRVLKNHVDGRYEELRIRWKKNLKIKFFFFFEFQAVLSVILSIPFLLMCINSTSTISLLEYCGIIIWCIAIIGETIADNQLKKFKSNPENKGKVCQVGLWNYSRHPNYFFEWLIWVGFFIAALSSQYGWISIICPLMMLYLLFRVTGIPMTEEQSLRSKGDAYREYQKTTSAFFPWKKK